MPPFFGAKFFFLFPLPMADSTSAPEASNTTENIDPNVLGLPEDDTAGFDEIFANYREQRLAQMKKEYEYFCVFFIF